MLKQIVQKLRKRDKRHSAAGALEQERARQRAVTTGIQEVRTALEAEAGFLKRPPRP